MKEEKIAVPEFMDACRTGDLEVVKKYANQHGNLNAKFSEAKLSAPMVAAMFNQPDVLQFLADKGADFLYAVKKNPKDKRGKSVLNYCRENSECRKIAIKTMFFQTVAKEAGLL